MTIEPIDPMAVRSATAQFGLNMELSKGVRRDVWLVYYMQGYIIIAEGELDTMYFNPQSFTGFNSSEGAVFDKIVDARAAFNDWYAARLT